MPYIGKKGFQLPDYKKADKVSGATAGDIAQLDANGNLIDSGIKGTDVQKLLDDPKPSTAFLMAFGGY